MGLFDELERQTSDLEVNKIIRAPFGYLGSKRKSLKHILPALPYRDIYVEPFGGSGIVLLNRRPSKLDVFNDRWAGIVAFYRCVRDEKKLQALVELCELSVVSREDFHFCRDTWQDCTDDVERAYRWYYMISTSFANKATTWGRVLNASGIKGQLFKKLPIFPQLHERFKNVQIENTDWRRILNDYDNEDAVFYLDPPYIDTDSPYKHNLTKDDHREMLHTVMNMKAFVAVSGFANSLYDSQEWDERITWDVTCTLAGNGNTGKGAGNNKEGLSDGYGTTEEVLWIKEAQ